MEKDLNLPEGTEVTEPLKIYLNEIGQIPLLSEEEERGSLGVKVLQEMRMQEESWKRGIYAWWYLSQNIILAEGLHSWI